MWCFTKCVAVKHILWTPLSQQCRVNVTEHHARLRKGLSAPINNVYFQGAKFNSARTAHGPVWTLELSRATFVRALCALITTIK